ncbi:Pentatricopeptide repeat - like 10 [Theobroma cacao]|nr:Pentatricopeptide repeat - like 10 [Theobroma cacao]
MFSSDSYVQTGVIRLYVEARLWVDARKVFDEIAYVDVVKWNVLMSGLARCRLGTQALSVFKEMLVFGIQPDEFCLTTALTACAQNGSLREGKWIHEYLRKREKCLELDVFIGTALVDMYAKCGCLDLAVEVFEGMSKRNVYSWAAMIGGFAVHGHARKAIHCFERMQNDGIRPDGVVLLGVLTACTHAGLVEEGLFLLNNMEGQYRIVPKHEHYSCVVDLLCRTGKFDEALKLIRRMPMRPLASVWGALLNSCRIYNNVQLAELAVKELLELEDCDGDEEDAALVQLSNIYFSAQKSEDGHRIRRMIGDRGLKKAPGCSMIEVDGRMTEFVSGDISHPLHSQIHTILRLLFPEDPGT